MATGRQLISDPAQGQTPGLLNVPQAASYLNIAAWTLRRWVSKGKIKHVKLGRLVRFRKQDLDRHIVKHLRVNDDKKDERVELGPQD